MHHWGQTHRAPLFFGTAVVDPSFGSACCASLGRYEHCGFAMDCFYTWYLFGVCDSLWLLSYKLVHLCSLQLQ